MKTLLTPSLLGFLIEKGYTHCLSKTLVKTDRQSSEIILIPLKVKPRSEYILAGYDACFDITREPVTMAAGIDHTDIYISLYFPGDDKRPWDHQYVSRILIP